MKLPLFFARIWQVAPLVLALVSALVIVLYPIFDYDLYWHLANGREMVQSGRIISEEVFSFTHFGQKFENHEWLAQIIFYLIWQTAGPYGLFGLKLLITALIVLLGYRTVRTMSGSPWLAALLCVFAVLAGYTRYVERPELFSLFNLALISFILYGYRAGQLPRAMLWFIPLTLILWNSLHGAVYGLIFLSLFVAGENIKHHFPLLCCEATDGHAGLSALNLCYAMVMLAMLIDPFGLRSYGIFLQIIGNESNTFAQVSEFMPINWEGFKSIILLLAWASLLAVRHIRRIDITQLILLLVFGAIAIRYRRASGETAIVLIPIIASLMAITAKQAVGRLQQALVTVMMLLAVAFVVGYGYKVKFADKSRYSFGYHLDDQYLPAGSVRFVQATGLGGNYYNTGHFGGYLSYYLAPERKIFQYNLPSVFGDTYSFDAASLAMTRWNFNYAIIGDRTEISELFPSYKWARIYYDPGAILVLRRTPQNQALIQQYELHFFHPMMQDDALRRQAVDSGILPRLAEEMGIYLAFRNDQHIAELWAEILTSNPYLRESPRIQQLLQQALKYNGSSKLAQLAI